MGRFTKLASLTKNCCKVEHILAVIFALYIVLDLSLPIVVEQLTSNMVVQIILGLGVLSLFSFYHPIVGILGLIALYELIQRSGGISNYQPSETKKTTQLENMNQTWPKTLEESVISDMAPLPTYGLGGMKNGGNYVSSEEPHNGTDI